MPILGGPSKPAQRKPPLTRSQYVAGAAKFGKYTLVKPGRKLGAVYIDDKMGSDGCVKACDSCIEKYWGFWKKSTLRPNWGYYFTSECDGCGETYKLCILFVPDPQFYKVLAREHGRVASPKRKLFNWPWRS